MCLSHHYDYYRAPPPGAPAPGRLRRTPPARANNASNMCVYIYIYIYIYIHMYVEREREREMHIICVISLSLSIKIYIYIYMHITHIRIPTHIPI